MTMPKIIRGTERFIAGGQRLHHHPAELIDASRVAASAAPMGAATPVDFPSPGDPGVLGQVCEVLGILSSSDIGQITFAINDSNRAQLATLLSCGTSLAEIVAATQALMQGAHSVAGKDGRHPYLRRVDEVAVQCKCSKLDAIERVKREAPELFAAYRRDGEAVTLRDSSANSASPAPFGPYRPGQMLCIS